VAVGSLRASSLEKAGWPFLSPKKSVGSEKRFGRKTPKKSVGRKSGFGWVFGAIVGQIFG